MLETQDDLDKLFLEPVYFPKKEEEPKIVIGDVKERMRKKLEEKYNWKFDKDGHPI